jgi:hypothetical protein
MLGDYVVCTFRVIGHDPKDSERMWAIQPVCPTWQGSNPPASSSISAVWHPGADCLARVWWLDDQDRWRPATPEEVAAAQLATGQAGGLWVTSPAIGSSYWHPGQATPRAWPHVHPAQRANRAGGQR